MIAAYTLWQREVVRFLRQRNRVVGALATPLVFWLLIGSGLGTSFRPASAAAGSTYLQYFFPGTILLIALFTAIFSTISIIEDRREGFLQGVLIAPGARAAIVWGKLLGGATLATLQGLVFGLLAPLSGLPMTCSSFLVLGLTLFVVGLGLTAIGFLIAWPLDSTQGFHALMNLVLMPLWLLSGALFPAEGAAGWVKVAIRLNPVHYAFEALRYSLQPDHLFSMGWITSLMGFIGFTAVLVCICLAVTTRYAGRNP